MKKKKKLFGLGGTIDFVLISLQTQKLVCMIDRPEDWPIFASKLSELVVLKGQYTEFNLVYKARMSNQTSSLVKVVV